MKRKKEYFVSVIIPVYNDFARLKLCIESLEKQTYPLNSYEIIVIDNGSEENPSTITELFPGVRFTVETRPGSYIARNKGILLAKGDILAFTDSDCIAESSWIRNGVLALTSGNNTGLVGGKINFTFSDPEKPKAIELFDSINDFDQKMYINQRKYSVGANLFTFKHVFEKIGVFSENLKSGGDYEWGNRVAFHGYDLVYADNACIFHPARQSFGEIFNKVTRCTGGSITLEKMNDDSKITSFLKLIHSLTPPIVPLLTLFSENRLHGALQKLKVAGVIFLVKYIGAWERIRLRLGGNPRR